MVVGWVIKSRFFLISCWPTVACPIIANQYANERFRRKERLKRVRTEQRGEEEVESAIEAFAIGSRRLAPPGILF